MTGYDPDGEKTLNLVGTYKNGKYHLDLASSVKKPGEPPYHYHVKTITDIAKGETWEWVSFKGSDYQKGRGWPREIPIPYMNIRAYKDMIFGPVTTEASPRLCLGTHKV